MTGRFTCEQSYCTTLSTMLGFGSVMFSKVDRDDGFMIICRWAYNHNGIDRLIQGVGVNEREALFDACDQQPQEPIVRDPICAN